jgi:hypothetical protein
MRIFVNGLQRTGTNYIRQLLQLNTNFDICDWENLYWKHHLYKNIAPNCDQVVCVIKNPYTWIESICFRNCVDIKEMYPQIVNCYDYIGNFEINLIEACKLYKEFYSSWLNFGVTLVHYEDMLDQDIICSFLKNNYNISLNNVEIPKHVKFSDFFNQNQIPLYKSYAISKLTSNNISVINDILTIDFINKVSYPIK